MLDPNTALASELLKAQLKYDNLVLALRNLPRYVETEWSEGKFFHKTKSFSMETGKSGQWHMRGDIEDLIK